jgi:hypothetical protein
MNKKLIRLTEADLLKIVKESVNMILSESNENTLEKWYRGYNSKYGSDKTHLIWLTNIEEARTYGNRVEEVIIDRSKINSIDIDDLYYNYLVEEFGYKDVDDYEEEGTWYPEEGVYPYEAEYLLRDGYNCYFFLTNDAECICMWDKSPIVSRRELTREEFEEIETYGSNTIRKYDDNYD